MSLTGILSILVIAGCTTVRERNILTVAEEPVKASESIAATQAPEKVSPSLPQPSKQISPPPATPPTSTASPSIQSTPAPAPEPSERRIIEKVLPQPQLERASPPPQIVEATQPPVPEAGEKAVASDRPGPDGSQHPVSTDVILLDPSMPEDAKKIQSRLAELGYYKGAIDGIWGKGSKAGLRSFKQDHSLKDPDKWDKETQMLMFRGTDQ